MSLLDDGETEDGDAFTPRDVRTEDEDIEELTAKLCHIHLPKLAEAGYIEWERETQTIRRKPKFDTVAPLVELVDDQQTELLQEQP